MVQMGAIRTLLEAGVFDAIPTGGQSISAAEITARTGVEKEIIGRDSRFLCSPRSSGQGRPCGVKLG